MEPTFIQWLIWQAGIGALAGLAVYAIVWLNEAHKDATVATARRLWLLWHESRGRRQLSVLWRTVANLLQ